MGGKSSLPAVNTAEIDLVKAELTTNHIVIFSGTKCGWCHRLADLLRANGLSQHAHTILLDVHPKGMEYAHGLNIMTGQRTIPNVFVNGKHVGGYTEVTATAPAPHTTTSTHLSGSFFFYLPHTHTGRPPDPDG